MRGHGRLYICIYSYVYNFECNYKFINNHGDNEAQATLRATKTASGRCALLC